MTIEERQRWMFRLSLIVGILAAIPAIAFVTHQSLPIPLLLAVVLALLIAGFVTLVLGVQHMRALARRSRTRR